MNQGEFHSNQVSKVAVSFQKWNFGITAHSTALLLPGLWSKGTIRCYRFKRNKMKSNESTGTHISDVGDVFKGYSLSEDNTHNTVSSHHSKEVGEFRRVRHKQEEQPWKREEHIMRHREIGHLRKKGNSEMVWWDQGKHWMGKRRYSRNFQYLFFCCNTKAKELESHTFQTTNLHMYHYPV